jgi:hypothetical protein
MTIYMTTTNLDEDLNALISTAWLSHNFNSGFWKYKKNPKLGNGRLFPSLLGKQMVCKLMEEN